PPAASWESTAAINPSNSNKERCKTSPAAFRPRSLSTGPSSTIRDSPANTPSNLLPRQNSESITTIPNRTTSASSTPSSSNWGSSSNRQQNRWKYWLSTTSKNRLRISLYFRIGSSAFASSSSVIAAGFTF